MRVHFLGVGEAFDERHPNTSLLLDHAGGALLLDCGFTAAAAFFRHRPWSDPDRLHGVWISHCHGDHFLGLPYLLARLREEGRRAPLAILGQDELRDKLPALLELAYPGLSARLDFDLAIHSVLPEVPLPFGGLTLRAALTAHGQPTLALRCDTPDGALFYSGDGAPSPASQSLAAGVGLLVQESYGLEDAPPGHGTAVQALAMARNAGAPRLALVHARRDLRAFLRESLPRLALASPGVQAWLPEAGEVTSINIIS